MKRFEREKYQGAILDYVFDWERWFDHANPLGGANDRIAASVWEAEDATIGLSGSLFTDTKTLIFISGGEPGRTYEVKNTITTEDSRRDVRVLYLTIL